MFCLDNFFYVNSVLQILTLEDNNRERQDDRQGKMLIHTEYSLLSLLKTQDGVVHHHGLFKVSVGLNGINTLICLSIGTPKNKKFSICSKWKIYDFKVSQN